MKKIVARIEKETVEVKSSTDLAIAGVEFNLIPAWKNWDMLRSKGWTNTRLKGDEKEPGYLIWQKGETSQEQLEIELSVHDWWCQMSDDYGVTLAGEKHMRYIQELMLSVGLAKAKELWNAYCPEEMVMK